MINETVSFFNYYNSIWTFLGVLIAIIVGYFAIKHFYLDKKNSNTLSEKNKIIEEDTVINNIKISGSETEDINVGNKINYTENHYTNENLDKEIKRLAEQVSLSDYSDEKKILILIYEHIQKISEKIVDISNEQNNKKEKENIKRLAKCSLGFRPLLYENYLSNSIPKKIKTKAQKLDNYLWDMSMNRTELSEKEITVLIFTTQDKIKELKEDIRQIISMKNSKESDEADFSKTQYPEKNTDSENSNNKQVEALLDLYDILHTHKKSLQKLEYNLVDKDNPYNVMFSIADDGEEIKNEQNNIFFSKFQVYAYLKKIMNEIKIYFYIPQHIKKDIENYVNFIENEIYLELIRLM